MTAAEIARARGFHFRSSLAAEARRPAPEPGAYEWWYFDALSDDGRDALVVIFLANFVFSPRYNRAAAAAHAEGERAPGGLETDAGDCQFPAVAFCLYRDGRPVVRAVNEYSARDFDAGAGRPECRIGASGFRFDRRPMCYTLEVNEPMRGGRVIEARLVWDVVDGDLTPEAFVDSDGPGAGHEWNLVAPRCRTYGSVAVRERATRRVVTSAEFAGTGYHDHNRDRRWLAATVGSWQWGRAHFDDVTAVFYRYVERGGGSAVNRLFLARTGGLAAHDAALSAGPARRDIFGLRYPRSMRITSTCEQVSLEVSQRRVIDRSFFYLRFTGEAALELGGRSRRARALTEQLSPRALLWRRLDWLTDMRIGRGGRTSFLK